MNVAPVARLHAQDVAALLEALQRHQRQRFVRGAVVGQEDHQRVVELPALLQLSQHAAHTLIDAVDLRRIDLHAPQLPGLVLGVGPGRLGRVTSARDGGSVEQALVAQALHAALAQQVPADIEAAVVLGDVGLTRVQWPVWRRVGQVEEEGRRAGLRLLVHEGAGFVGDRIGVVEAGRQRFVLGIGLAARQRAGLEERAAAGEGAEEAVEAAPRRPGLVGLAHLGTQVPLAGQAGRVAGGLQRLGDRHAVRIDRARVAARPVVVGEDADAGLVRVQAGEQRGARRAAARSVVELREAYAAACQAIEIRGPDLTAVAADVGEPHVVDENQDDVR